jgi:Domain of unknown function (DUF4157)
MSEAAALQTQTTKAPPSNSNSLFVQRKCACGGSSGLTGSCSDCEKKKLLGEPLQTKLRINEPGDEYEQEADRVAEQVMRMADPGKGTETDTTKPTAPLVQRKVNAGNAGIDTAPPIVHDVLASLGQPLDAATRAFFEPRFGHDFGNVRIHADMKAAESAAYLSARAYTSESKIVFGARQYELGTAKGRALLAHELTHVMQQSLGEKGLQRAEVEIDSVNVTVNFDYLDAVRDESLVEQILSMINSWVGSGFYGDSFRNEIDNLDAKSRRWLLFAIQLLRDNRNLVDPSVIVVRLTEYAPQAVHPPSPDETFIREALRVSGWLESASMAALIRPDRKTKRKVEKLVSSPAKDLDVAGLRQRLVPALEYFIRNKDPKLWEEKQGTRSIESFQTLGDILALEARNFFAPYADVAPSNIFVQEPRWKGSTHIYELEDQPTTDEDLKGLLFNRAEMVGRNADPGHSDFNDANIFKDVSFDDNREADNSELRKIVEELLAKQEIKEIVERYDNFLGEQTQSPIGPRIGLASKFDATRYPSACAGHWKGIDTLCHEMVHAMVAPRFKASVKSISFDQLIREGFTEVLGAQLYNDRVVPKAKNDGEFKSSIEAGVAGSPCPDPATAAIDYGAAGQAAEEIRQLVGDNNFRAAYFLGRPSLAGLPE